jgi:acyl carrier protein
MTRKEILDKVAETVSETLSIELGELDESTSFDDYDADSLDRLEVLVALEDALGVEIDDDDASELKTVGDLVDAIEREL